MIRFFDFVVWLCHERTRYFKNLFFCSKVKTKGYQWNRRSGRSNLLNSPQTVHFCCLWSSQVALEDRFSLFLGSCSVTMDGDALFPSSFQDA